MGLPLVPMTVSWPADTKLFVRGTTATRKRHSAQIDAGDMEYRRPGVRASALGLALPSIAGATHVYEMKVAENDARRAEPLGSASPPDYPEVTCRVTRETPAEQGFHRFCGVVFWLLQGEWDGGAQEFERCALGGGRYGEQVEAGFVVAGNP